MGQSLSEIFPPKTKFTTDDIPDLTGKVVIVTGGNGGIGKATCKHLLLHNAKVYMASRSAERAKAAIEELKESTKKEDIHFLQCDLADLESVKATVEEFKSKETELHILFNNAGVMMTPMDMLTKQGYDMQFGTNVIGHAYLTILLLPTLLATAKSSPDGKVRVVTTSSNGHLGAAKGGILYDTVKDGPIRNKKLGSFPAYFQSKWANVVFAKELGRRYGDQGIVSTSLNPGGIDTELPRHASKLFVALTHWMTHPADPDGALTQLYAGTAPAAASLNGKYLLPWAREGLARSDTENEQAGKTLWEFIEQATAQI